MTTIRQLQAVVLLVLRSLHRMGPRLRSGQKPEPTRGLSAVMMRLLFAVLMANFGWTLSRRILSSEHPSWVATWIGLCLGCFSVATALALELPSPRMPSTPLKSQFLEALPLSRSAKLVLLLAQTIAFVPVVIVFAVSLRAGRGGGYVDAIALALLLHLAIVLFGANLGRTIKRFAAPHRAARLYWLGWVFMFPALIVVNLAPQLGEPPFGDALGRAFLGQGSWTVIALLLLVCVLLSLGFAHWEGRLDMSEPVRPGVTLSALSKGANLRAIERILTRREPGGRSQVPILFSIFALMVGTITLTLSRFGAVHLRPLVLVLLLQIVGSLGTQRAARAAARDLLARPLLGALPISPRDTLASKAATLRSSLLIVAAPVCLMFGAVYRDPEAMVETGFRIVTLLLAVAVFASAQSYVAFLTVGLGASQPRTGTFGSLESFLVLVPLASVCFAPGPFSALLALGTLGAVTFEARRAAMNSIDWLDDPEVEHGTEVWKALVVFGGFQGAQLLTYQLSQLFRDGISPTIQGLGSYLIAGTALWLLTQREQVSYRPLYRVAFAPIGLLTGGVSAACAWLYVRFASAVPNARSLELDGHIERALAVFAIVVVAPLVEERFFRGWLQAALQRTFPKRTYFAPILTGLAFAAAHPAHSFVPVLVLGLINGALMWRLRSLSACVVTHAVHNAFALYLAS